jgi:diketogulonate reductase-like aldo/keto reductase
MAAVGDRRAQEAALLKTITLDGQGPARVAVLPLALVSRTDADRLITGLRQNYGEAPLDYVVLGRPVSLSGAWRDNNFDHAAKLTRAWAVLAELQEAGATRALGIAHAGAEVLDLVRGTTPADPALNLLEFHPFLRGTSLVAQTRERGALAYALHPLGPPARDGATGFISLEHPAVNEIAERHGRPAADVVLRWALGYLDGAVLSDSEAHAGGSLTEAGALDLAAEEVAALDELDCGFRVDRSASTMASLYGYTSGEPLRVEPAPTEGLEVGCHKVLYAGLTNSESFNRRYSFFVWRNVFNLPATVDYARSRPRLSPVSERIRSDLDRDGFAVTTVEELGCTDAYERVRSEAAALVERVRRQEERGKHPLYRYVTKTDHVHELAEVHNLTDAIDDYCGLRTMVDDASLITIPARLAGASKQQLWHSDLEDLYTVKAYTFLTDVDDFSGPLDYILETHPKGRFAVQTAELWKRSFVQDPTPAYSFQVPDELLFRHVRPDLLRRLMGPAGTVVVFDARGLHRGGHVLQGLRQVAVTSHTAPNQVHPWRGPRSRWSSLWYPFRWETNVTLRNGTPALPKRIGRALLRRREQRPSP